MSLRRKCIVFFTLLLACLTLAACAVISHPRFGKYPEGERLERIRQSPNYRDGAFAYPLPTPQLAQGHSLFSILWTNHVTSRPVRTAPDKPLPVVKTDLKGLDRQQDLVIWLGHSSFFAQVSGRRFLVDPVFSDYAAPFSFANKAFAGTSLYSAADMPAIDYLLITHDHWDHLDYPTVTALKDKVGEVILPLGVGAHLEHWGYAPDRMHEVDWNESVNLGDGLLVHVLPGRHFSGRWLTRNRSLWASFALVSQTRRIFFSGDSGYGPHFADIGRALGPFDLVMLDSGQYDPRWPHMHMTPEEAAQAAQDLEAESLLAAHVGRFSLAPHPWDEPFERISAAASERPYRLVTPMIGEPVRLGDPHQAFSPWWTDPAVTSLSNETEKSGKALSQLPEKQ